MESLPTALLFKKSKIKNDKFDFYQIEFQAFPKINFRQRLVKNRKQFLTEIFADLLRENFL